MILTRTFLGLLVTFGRVADRILGEVPRILLPSIMRQAISRPIRDGKPPASAGQNEFGNAPSSSWYQLEGDTYAPFGAVLTNSTGDLIFALNATAQSCPGGSAVQGPCNPNDRLGWSGVTIYLPPGFTMPAMDGSNVVTTVTNSYGNIQVWKISPYDRYAGVDCC